MSPRQCELELDADAILTALDEGIDGLDSLAAVGHVARCESCQEVVRLRAKARTAWTSGIRSAVPALGGAHTAVAADDSLRRAWEGRDTKRAPKTLDRQRIALAAATSFAALAIVLAVVRQPSDPLRAVSTSDMGSARIVDTAPPSEQLSTSAPPLAPSGTSPRVAARRVVVPAGSHVTLGFSIGAGDLGPDDSAELVGPATATTSDTSLTLQRGTVRVHGLRRVTVNVPGAKLDPNGATCTIEVDARGVARVNVESGRALVTGRGGGLVTVESGGSLELDPDGALRVTTPPPLPASPPPVSDEESVRQAALSTTVPPKAPPPTPSGAPGKLVGGPDEALSTARSRMRNGETTAARSDLERLAVSSDARVARRASFTLAEMDLVSGDRAKAHVRLEDLLVCPEPALGADAATLLARSLPSPADRAAVWKRFLATNPPRPYFERALLDRAESLLDAGRGAEARAILDDVQKAPSLTDAQKRQLERLLFKARELR